MAHESLDHAPVVLHHGIFGFGPMKIGPLKIEYFIGIDRAMADAGHPVIAASVHPCASIATRARQLKEQILARLDHMDRSHRRVIIFAHSMGGLDARHMITHLGMADRVAALVTVCTPHRGSSYADWCAINLGKRLGGYRLLRNLGLDIGAALDLTTESCRWFNEQTPDHPEVAYYSVAGCRPWHRVPPNFYHSHAIIQKTEGDNDGLVSVESAKWGEFLGVWPADHVHAVGRRMVLELTDPTGPITPYYLRTLQRVVMREAASHDPASR